ncbi:MAG: GntR family transcriptional regulator [Myxococcota bacterium]
MRTIIVDHDSAVPVYQQIADALRGLVARGQLSAGTLLPSVRQLGRQLGVNLNTVAKAYRILSDEGLVELRQGAPAKVASTAGNESSSVRGAQSAQLDPATIRTLHRVIDTWVLNGADRKRVEKLLAQAVERYFRAAKATGEHR